MKGIDSWPCAARRPEGEKKMNELKNQLLGLMRCPNTWNALKMLYPTSPTNLVEWPEQEHRQRMNELFFNSSQVYFPNEGHIHNTIQNLMIICQVNIRHDIRPKGNKWIHLIRIVSKRGRIASWHGWNQMKSTDIDQTLAFHSHHIWWKLKRFGLVNSELPGPLSAAQPLKLNPPKTFVPAIVLPDTIAP